MGKACFTPGNSNVMPFLSPGASTDKGTSEVCLNLQARARLPGPPMECRESLHIRPRQPHGGKCFHLAPEWPLHVHLQLFENVLGGGLPASICPNLLQTLRMLTNLLIWVFHVGNYHLTRLKGNACIPLRIPIIREISVLVSWSRGCLRLEFISL